MSDEQPKRRPRRKRRPTGAEAWVAAWKWHCALCWSEMKARQGQEEALQRREHNAAPMALQDLCLP